MNKLDVYFHGQKVGVLKENNSHLSFKYLEGVTTPIAHLLPVQKATFDDKETRAFFSNLLPEGDIAKKIAQIRQVSINNPFAMLKEIGGECAGAISLYPEDITPQVDDKLNEISEKQIAQILKNLPECPLLTAEDIRLSLAGAQEKLALTSLADDNRYFLPNDKYISTWIIKPQNPNFTDLIYNEYFCMTLASSIGLETARCVIEQFDDQKAYKVQRFDRVYSIREIPNIRDLTSIRQPLNTQKSLLKRLHQEDFCQALGLSGKKYQKEGGPSIKQCFKFIHNNNFMNKARDEMNLLNTIIFNFLIGNSDAHGKNFSFLHQNHQYTLSPLYDLVSTQIYPNLAKDMAMAIGGEYNPDKINQSHFIKMAEDLEIKPKLIIDSIKKISELTTTYANGLNNTLTQKETVSPIYDEIIKIIETRTKQIT